MKENSNKPTGSVGVFARKQIITVKIAPYVFISPFFILFAIFMIYPICYSLILSLHEFQGIASKSFVGFRNYLTLFKTQRFLYALSNTTRFAGGMLVLSVVTAFLLSLILNSKRIPGRNLFRLALFLPVLTSTVVAAALFRLILVDTSAGLLNSAIKIFGVPPQRWLLDNFWSLKSVILVACWRTLGLNTVYFIAGLQGLPYELYESAVIDGASPFQQLRYLTIPLMRPVIAFVAVITLIQSYLVFTEVFMLSPATGSTRDNMITLGYYLYESAFRFFKFGYGASVGFVMTLIILVLSVFQLMLLGVFRKE
jgi:arabinosaccharide transport system permease protein